ncbi:MAG: DUF2147 domain-containing protein [Saprospiraceae bacterium]|uniref:DUF2147 domain-containing protein n=1 Tax=Candidatus Opimibacter skivensis TaxID=2982028 RepID=A0A9D7XQX9_9BACT|nr:DUF2147 domain-containing protein [Candidatus Opimibacter skivensis]
MYRIVINFLTILLVLISSHGLKAQVTGLWKTIDDRDGSEKSVIEIYEQDGKLHGKVIKLLKGSTYTTCENCHGDLKDKALVGMTIIHDLTKTATGGIDGTVMDPNNGKTYSCLIELESPDKLRLRGYIGLPAFGRTQYWYRVQ